MTAISIVTPIFQAAATVRELHRRLVEQLTEMVGDDFEIVMVDDGSPDAAWLEIQQVAATDRRVVAVRLSRNFGQHHALTAGLDFACGDLVVLMDCDLQDAPEEIPVLIAKLKEGYDIVLARRLGRPEGLIVRALSRVFHGILDFLADTRVAVDPAVGTFRAMTSQVVQAYRSMPERNRFFGGMVGWLGFSSAYVDVRRNPRYAGSSSYSFKRKVDLAIDGITSFSEKPLRVSVKLGVLLCVGSFLFGLLLIYQRLFEGVGVPGWTSILVSIYFLSGILLFHIGIIGIYLGKVFSEVKGRPVYVVKDTMNTKRSGCHDSAV